MNGMDFQAALKSHTAKFKELAKKLSSDSGWDGGWIGLADEERKVIADFKSFAKENRDRFPDDYYEALINELNKVHIIGDDFDNDEDEEF